jgi:hypothetical protein
LFQARGGFLFEKQKHVSGDTVALLMAKSDSSDCKMMLLSCVQTLASLHEKELILQP